jgi:glutamate 5-kinase
LLPAGVISVVGEFFEGDLVAISDQGGTVIARGVVRVDAATARATQGKRTDELSEQSAGVVVHRDDLVLLIA